MSIPELARLLQVAMNEGGRGYLVVVEDEDGEIYPITDVDLVPDREVLVLRVDSRPMELRGS